MGTGFTNLVRFGGPGVEMLSPIFTKGGESSAGGGGSSVIGINHGGDPIFPSVGVKDIGVHLGGYPLGLELGHGFGMG